MAAKFRPRNDFVLIRKILVDKVRGIAMPEIAIEGQRHVIVAVGPDKCSDLKVGDSVLMAGKVGQDIAQIPGHTDLYLARQDNVVLVIEKEDNGPPPDDAVAAARPWGDPNTYLKDAPGEPEE